MYVCAIFACLVPAEVKRDGIETNYWMVMSHHVGQGNEPVSSQEEQVLLTAESSPQTQKMILKWHLDMHVSVMAR